MKKFLILKIFVTIFGLFLGSCGIFSKTSGVPGIKVEISNSPSGLLPTNGGNYIVKISGLTPFRQAVKFSFVGTVLTQFTGTVSGINIVNQDFYLALIGGELRQYDYYNALVTDQFPAVYLDMFSVNKSKHPTTSITGPGGSVSITFDGSDVEYYLLDPQLVTGSKYDQGVLQFELPITWPTPAGSVDMAQVIDFCLAVNDYNAFASSLVMPNSSTSINDWDDFNTEVAKHPTKKRAYFYRPDQNVFELRYIGQTADIEETDRGYGKACKLSKLQYNGTFNIQNTIL